MRNGFKKGHTPWSKGKHVSAETKFLMKLAQRERRKREKEEGGKNEA